MPDQTYELLTAKFHVFPAGGSYKVYVTDKSLCRSLNRLLLTYEDYVFQDGDEGVFHFNEAQLPEVKKALRIKV